MMNTTRQWYSKLLVLLVLTAFLVQFSQSIDSKEKADDSLAFDEQFDHHQLSRRSSKKVAQMLQQILQRGEVQVEPYRIHKFLGRLQRRKSNDLLSSLKI